MAKKKGQTATGESKTARFVRVVTPRIKKAIKAIRVVGYCSSSAYEYEAKQIEAITATLTGEVALLKKRFEQKKKQEDVEFTFPED